MRTSLYASLAALTLAACADTQTAEHTPEPMQEEELPGVCDPLNEPLWNAASERIDEMLIVMINADTYMHDEDGYHAHKGARTVSCSHNQVPYNATNLYCSFEDNQGFSDLEHNPFRGLEVFINTDNEPMGIPGLTDERVNELVMSAAPGSTLFTRFSSARPGSEYSPNGHGGIPGHSFVVHNYSYRENEQAGWVTRSGNCRVQENQVIPEARRIVSLVEAGYEFMQMQSD